MTHTARLRLLLLILLVYAIPAYANNPPQPDGMFSILLIFPLAILASKSAGVEPLPAGWLGITLALILAFCTFLLTAGSSLATLPLLIVLLCAISYAIRIVWRGQGMKKVLLGAGLALWSLFAVADYVASLFNYPHTVLAVESQAIGRLRNLASAEDEFRNPTDSQRAPSPAFGTIAELHAARLTSLDLPPSHISSGYRYGEIIDSAHNQFFFYAVPSAPYKEESFLYQIVPGGSLLWSFVGVSPNDQPGRRSFAVDETGVIRVTENHRPGDPITREESRRWNPLS